MKKIFLSAAALAFLGFGTVAAHNYTVVKYQMVDQRSEAQVPPAYIPSEYVVTNTTDFTPCTDNGSIVYAPTGHTNCNGRIRQVRTVGSGYARRGRTAVNYAQPTKINSNIIGWQNARINISGQSSFQYMSAAEKQAYIQAQKGSTNLRSANLHAGDRYVINESKTVSRNDWNGNGDIRAVKAFWSGYDAQRSALVGREVKTNADDYINQDSTNYGQFYGSYVPTDGVFIPTRRVKTS